MNIIIALALVAAALSAGYALGRRRRPRLNRCTVAENIIATMPDFLILANAEGKITGVNQALLDFSGYREDELIGKPLEMLVAEGLDHEQFEQLVKAGNVSNYELKARRKDGRTAAVSINGSVIRNKQGGVAGIVSIARDVTALKNAEGEKNKLQAHLVESAKMAAIGELASGVAHELNNPLTIMLGTTQLLMRNADKESTLFKDLQNIETISLRFKKIISSLLTYSRRKNTGFMQIDMLRVIDEAFSLVGHQIELSNIKVVKNLSDGLPPVMGDAQKLEEALINLLTNAREAMPDGGELTITACRRDKAVVIEVRDTGCGINKEFLNCIFDPFFSTKPLGKGVGLGLSISRNIVEEHRGALTVESTPKAGSVFTISIPVAPHY